MSKSRVLLINPPGQIFRFPDGRPAHRKHCTPPLGLAYLAANLLREGFEVIVLDALSEGYEQEEITDDSIVYGLSPTQVATRVIELKPDFIGISVLFSSVVDSVYRMARAIKQACPTIPIILGGQHPSGCAFDVLRNPDVDYVIEGEGDLSFPALLNALIGGEDPGGVPRVVYRSGNEILRSPSDAVPAHQGSSWVQYKPKDASVPLNLDELPLPAWHLFPMERYWSSDVRLGSGDAVGQRYGVMVTSRGCPHICGYCTSPLLSGYRGYRRRSIDAVIAEIRWLSETFGIDEISFNDDNFFVNKKRAKELLRRIGQEFPGMYFSVPGGTEVNSLDEEMVDLLEAANFYKITLNIESVNADLQGAVIEKNVKVDRVPSIVSYLRSKKIETRAALMIGFPHETMQSIRNTVDFALSLDVDDFGLFIVSPLPGTPLFDQCLQENLFVEGFSPHKVRYALSTIRLPEISPEQLEDLRHEAWKHGFEERRKRMSSFVTERRKAFQSIEDYESAGFLSVRRADGEQ